MPKLWHVLQPHRHENAAPEDRRRKIKLPNSQRVEGGRPTNFFVARGKGRLTSAGNRLMLRPRPSPSGF